MYKPCHWNVSKAFDIRAIKMDAQKLIMGMINQQKCGGRMHLQCHL